MNLAVSISAFLLGASFLVFIYNMINSWIRGEVAEANPWHARTLEWQTSSPPPLENFPVLPEVTGHPYDYGLPKPPHATFPQTGGAHAASPAGGLSLINISEPTRPY